MNLRLLGPEPSALTGLRYIPTGLVQSLPGALSVKVILMNAPICGRAATSPLSPDPASSKALCAGKHEFSRSLEFDSPGQGRAYLQRVRIMHNILLARYLTNCLLNIVHRILCLTRQHRTYYRDILWQTVLSCVFSFTHGEPGMTRKRKMMPGKYFTGR